jgi:hypothetical protein
MTAETAANASKGIFSRSSLSETDPGFFKSFKKLAGHRRSGQ